MVQEKRKVIFSRGTYTDGDTLVWNAATNAWKHEPAASVSTPPSGGRKVTNIYVDSEGKLVVEYDTTPVP
jgi:hypothetical protein